MPPPLNSALRLLLPSSPLPLFKSPLFTLSFSRSFLSAPPRTLNLRSPLAVYSYYGRRERMPAGGGGNFHQRRGKGTGTAKEDTRREKGAVEEKNMEKGEGAGFNKRRAEGRDKSDQPKNLQLKTRKLNPINTICYAQILGTGMDTQDTSPSVLLFFDKQRFIFNAGEGLQRFCTEHKIKLSKIDHMFFTRVCSETAGGLPGLLLTLAGYGEEGMAVNIWGPSDLNYLVDAMRSFIPNAAIVHAHSFGLLNEANPALFSAMGAGKSSDQIVIIDDEVVQISAICLRPKCSDGSSLKPGDIAVTYACELPEIKGKFDLVKAAAFGLKPGPKYRELQLGNSVKSDLLNVMVHPSDVLGPSIPGPILLLVDCPTLAHMSELVAAPSFENYYADCTDQQKENKKCVSCIIHLGPASITTSIGYQKWMERFGNTQHIMAGHETKYMEIPILKSSAIITSRLNYLCPQLFPASGCWSSQQNNAISFQHSNLHEESVSTLGNSISAQNLLKFHFRPLSLMGLDKSAIPSSQNHEEVVSELLSEIPEIADAAKQINHFCQRSIEYKDDWLPKENGAMVEEPWILNSCIEANANVNVEKLDCNLSENSCQESMNGDRDIPACLKEITRDEMEIVLLGTGSSQPSKYRNVSSIFINLFSRGSILLDCGEGSLAQLKRRFGVKGADDALKGLKCIWISHIHADHHAGLARILALRRQLLKDVHHEPLLVIGPRQLKRFLDAYSRLEDLDMQFLDCRNTLEASMNALLASDSKKGSLPENPESKERKHSGTKTTSVHRESNLFSQGGRMESFWKRPGSPVDAAATLPVLLRLKERLSEAGLESLYSVPVVHCPHAFGVVLKAKERLNSTGKAIPGWKLVYSGDTRPCQALIDASQDAAVLIHEATFEDSLMDEAIARNHSTTKEAIEVGTSAGAYRVILTHFSQRYPKILVFDEADMHKTCIAFDLMSVNLADLCILPRISSYLKLLFRNEMVTDESDDVHELVL